MSKFIVIFDKPDMDMMIVDGTIQKCRELIGEIMIRPVKIGKSKCFLSQAAVWGYDPATKRRNDVNYGMYKMGVLEDVRVGMWWDAKTDKYHLLKKNGGIAYDIDKGVMDILYRKEMKTRASRVKEKKYL